MSSTDNQPPNEAPLPKEEIISTVTWQGVPITITYTPIWSAVLPKEEKILSHVGVKADQALPITETGYRSIFFQQTESELLPSLDTYVLALLNEQAQSKKWKTYWADKQQLSLFQ